MVQIVELRGTPEEIRQAIARESGRILRAQLLVERPETPSPAPVLAHDEWLKLFHELLAKGRPLGHRIDFSREAMYAAEPE